MTLETFFEKFDLFANTPDAVGRMRKLVLELGVQGKLIEQNTIDVPAIDSLRRCTKAIHSLTVNEEFAIPRGWASIPLGCVIASNLGGGTPSKQNPAYWNGPIPWASVKDIQTNKYLTETVDSITKEGLRNSSSNIIPTGRLIVVTRMGLGKLAINKIPVAINQDLRAIQPNEALDLDFAYLLFKALKLVGKGVTVKGVTIEQLHSLAISLPPLAEQKRIVAKVDELMALCDRLEAQQQERETQHTALTRAALARFSDAPTTANLDLLFHKTYSIPPADLRKSILTLAVQGKLVPQETTAEMVSLESILAEASVNGVSKGPTSNTSATEILRISAGTSRTDFYVDEGDFKHVDLPPNEIDKFRLMPGDLLACRFNGNLHYVGRFSYYRGESGRIQVNPDKLIRFRVNTETHCPRYVCYAMNAEPTREAIEAMCATTAGNIGLSAGKLKTVEIPVPALAEQRRIVAKVDELIALVNALETQLATARITAEKLMEAVVAELTTQD